MAQRITDAMPFPLPRRAVTFPRMLAAIQELTALCDEWHNAESRSKDEQEWMLYCMRGFLREIEAGYVENLAERFRHVTEDPIFRARRFKSRKA